MKYFIYEEYFFELFNNFKDFCFIIRVFYNLNFKLNFCYKHISIDM